MELVYKLGIMLYIEHLVLRLSHTSLKEEFIFVNPSVNKTALDQILLAFLHFSFFITPIVLSMCWLL